MKFGPWSSVAAVTLFATLAMLAGVAEQNAAAQETTTTHHHYKLFDVGTFGGPNSQFSSPGSIAINNRGTATGFSDTSIPDPNCLIDCLVNHAFVWKDGITTDLGPLPGGASSFAYWVNSSGLIVGQSLNGLIDLLTGFPEEHGVLWRNGQIIDLGTLGGTQSNANAINDYDQVVGGALNAIPDPFAGSTLTGVSSLGSFAQTYIFAPATTQTHAFLWSGGKIQDLGTLGGPDSNALVVNDAGQVAGISFINFIANPSGVPTLDPFLWDRGQMIDLGNFGGTSGFPTWLNNSGQLVGVSNLPGDQTFHPFLWDRGELKDLGTLGGYTGQAFFVNDAGEAVGYADLTPDPLSCSGLACIHHAFLWKHGVMKDLGTLGNGTCSRALSINQSGQIVGATSPCAGEFAHGFLWENGGPIVDLSALVLDGSGIAVRDGDYINDRGEVAARGVLSNGDVHAVLLIPCDENHPDIAGCDYSLVDAESVQSSVTPIPTANAAATPANLAPSEMTDRVRALLTKGNRRPGVLAPK